MRARRFVLVCAVGALAACAAEGPDRGELEAELVVRTPSGENAGEATVWRLADGSPGLLEETRIRPEDAPGQRVEVLSTPERYRVHRRVGREVEEVEVSFGASRTEWRRTKGLRVERTETEAAAPILIEELTVPQAEPVGSATLWVRLARRLAEADDIELELPAYNARLGRGVTLYASRREARRLEVNGQPRSVERWFVSTAATGHSLWLDPDDGTLLQVDGVLGGHRLSAEGFAAPERSLRPRPEAIVEEELTARGDDVVLAGTLSRPTGAEAPRPVAILVHGSGPTDRDESPLMVFRDVAHHLSLRGWAVLRYDKRGVGESELLEDPPDVSLEALAGDVETWIGRLGERPDLDTGCTVLIGHSEGGYIVPLVANRAEQVAGVVLLAGPVDNMHEILAQQLVLILRAHGESEAGIEALARRQRATLRAIAKSVKTPNRRDEEPGHVLWLRSHARHRPEAVLSELRVPMLALYAGGDVQVPVSQAASLRALVAEHDLKDVTVEVIPGLDHVLMDDLGGRSGMGLLFDPDRRIDPRVLDRVASWLDGLECPG